MNRSEFKDLKKYLLRLKDEQADLSFVDTLHTPEFYTMIPLLLNAHPDVTVRDLLDVDGTFAVLFPVKGWTLREAVNFYETLSTIVGTTTYTSVENSGFVDFEEVEVGTLRSIKFEGFWLHLQ